MDEHDETPDETPSQAPAQTPDKKPDKTPTERPDAALSATQTRVLQALRCRSDGATAPELAQATGLAYSTTTRLLRELHELGLACRIPSAEQPRSSGRETTRWKPADKTATTPRHTASSDAPASHAETPAGPHGPDNERSLADAATTGGTTGAEKPPAAAARAPAATDTVAGPTRRSADKGPVTAGAVQRLAKGELRAKVLAVLRAYPGQALSASQIGKQLPGRSLGAIANACDRLVADELAVLVTDKPRRFTAKS